jgi:hypothetical protein
VSSATPAISTAISPGVCKKPRLTMSVVAPVGGCEDLSKSRTAPVSAMREGAGQDRNEVADEGVAWARRLGHWLLEEEERRRPEAREEERLPREVCC